MGVIYHGPTDHISQRWGYYTTDPLITSVRGEGTIPLTHWSHQPEVGGTIPLTHWSHQPEVGGTIPLTHWSHQPEVGVLYHWPTDHISQRWGVLYHWPTDHISQRWGVLYHWPTDHISQRWGVLYQFSKASKHWLPVANHVHIWLMSMQLSRGDSCQTWMSFEESNIQVCNITTIQVQ